MSSVRDPSAGDEIKRALIGFEQGVNIKTIEQLRSQTRARFSPTEHPKISVSEKRNQKASVMLRIEQFPFDPGTGKYNLEIESSNGKTLRIKAIEANKATGKLTVTSPNWSEGTFSITDYYGVTARFKANGGSSAPGRDTPETSTSGQSNVSVSNIVAGNEYVIKTKGTTDFTAKFGAVDNNVGTVFKALVSGNTGTSNGTMTFTAIDAEDNSNPALYPGKIITLTDTDNLTVKFVLVDDDHDRVSSENGTQLTPGAQAVENNIVGQDASNNNIVLPAEAVGAIIVKVSGNATYGAILDALRVRINAHNPIKITAEARDGNSMVVNQDVSGNTGNNKTATSNIVGISSSGNFVVPPSDGTGTVDIFSGVSSYNYTVGTSGLVGDDNNKKLNLARRIQAAIELAIRNGHLTLATSTSDFEINITQAVDGLNGNREIVFTSSNESNANSVFQCLTKSGISGGTTSFLRTRNGQVNTETTLKFTSAPTNGEIKFISLDGTEQKIALLDAGFGKSTATLAAQALKATLTGIGSIQYNPSGLVTNRKYQIVKTGDTPWTTLGATSNAVGTIFNKNDADTSGMAGQSGRAIVAPVLSEKITVSGDKDTLTITQPSGGVAGQKFVSFENIVQLNNVIVTNPNLKLAHHPSDPNSFALGLSDAVDPIFKKEQFTEWNSQRLKRVTFDISQIINANSLEYGLKSRIVGDDTLMIVQETPGEVGESKIIISGAINPTASTTVNGVNTKFTSELKVGDRIEVSGEIRTIDSISSDTQLSVTQAFTDVGNDTSPKVIRIPEVRQSNLSYDFLREKFSLKNFRLQSVDLVQDYFRDIPTVSKVVDKTSRSLECLISGSFIVDGIKKVLNKGGKRSHEIMRFQFTSPRTEAFENAETPEQSDFEPVNNSDVTKVIFYLSRHKSFTTKYEIKKDGNVYKIAINVIPPGTSSNRFSLIEKTVYARLKTVLENIASKFFSINMTLDKNSNPKKVIIEENARLTSFSMGINGIRNAFTDKDFSNFTKSIIKFNGIPDGGNITVSSEDGSSHVIGFANAGGGESTSRLAAQELKATLTATTAPLKDKIEVTGEGNILTIIQKGGGLGKSFITSTLTNVDVSEINTPISKVDVYFRDQSEVYYYLKPNHDLSIRSFGFGKNVNNLAKFEDMSLQGPKKMLSSGSIEVSTATGWVDTSQFTFTIPSQGSDRIVTFKGNTNSAQAAKLTNDSFTFGLQNANTTSLVTERIYNSLALAFSGSNLGIASINPLNGNRIVLESKHDSSAIPTLSTTDDINNKAKVVQFGQTFTDYPSSLTVDPMLFLTDTGDVRFPIQQNNFGLIMGYEYDGIIEPIEIRRNSVDRMITEIPFYGIKGSLHGSYNYTKIQRSSEIISNEITFEKTNIVPFLDNAPTIGEQMGMSEVVFGRRQSLVDVVYAKVPGVILKNDRKIYPFIDTEERIFQALPLESNNPDNVENDNLVANIFELGNFQNLLLTDDRNLGGENFRRRAGFDFSSPHPGTDSIAFGGLTYV